MGNWGCLKFWYSMSHWISNFKLLALLSFRHTKFLLRNIHYSFMSPEWIRATRQKTIASLASHLLISNIQEADHPLDYYHFWNQISNQTFNCSWCINTYYYFTYCYFLVIGGLKSVCIKSNNCKWFMYLFPGTVRRHAVAANVLSAISYMQGHASS